MSLESIQIINLPKIIDPRGNLSYFESNNHIPFKIKRTYWIYDVPGGEIRGSHAFKEAKEFLVCLSGSFDVNLYDGSDHKKIHLNRSYYGLYIPNKIWKTLDNFSTNAVTLVVASTMYDMDDYIRDVEEFKNSIKNA
ncbi:MAG: WxcM-like domain-containing protein [Flavobacteriaceae bacterium]|nr:WxcM-like domain-containing protein [Flavobacteriaceae bacterium]